MHTYIHTYEHGYLQVEEEIKMSIYCTIVLFLFREPMVLYNASNKNAFLGNKKSTYRQNHTHKIKNELVTNQ